MTDVSNESVRAQLDCAYFEELFANLYRTGFEHGQWWSIHESTPAHLDQLNRYRGAVQNLFKTLYGLSSSSVPVSQRVFFALYPCYDGDEAKSRRFWGDIERFEHRPLDFVEFLAGFIDGALTSDIEIECDVEVEGREDHDDSEDDMAFEDHDQDLEELETSNFDHDWCELFRMVESFDAEERMSATKTFVDEFPPDEPLPIALYGNRFEITDDQEVAAIDRLLLAREPARYVVMTAFLQTQNNRKATRAEISKLEAAEAEVRIKDLVQNLDSSPNPDWIAKSSMSLTSFGLLFPSHVDHILEAWATRPDLRVWLSITLQAIACRDAIVANKVGEYVSDSDTTIAGAALLILVFACHGEFVEQANEDIRIEALSQAHHRVCLGDRRYLAVLVAAQDDESEIVRNHARSLLALLEEGDWLSDG